MVMVTAAVRMAVVLPAVRMIRLVVAVLVIVTSIPWRRQPVRTYPRDGAEYE